MPRSSCAIAITVVIILRYSIHRMIYKKRFDFIIHRTCSIFLSHAIWLSFDLCLLHKMLSMISENMKHRAKNEDSRANEETQLHHKYFVWNKTTLEIVLNAFSNILLFIAECCLYGAHIWLKIYRNMGIGTTIANIGTHLHNNPIQCKGWRKSQQLNSQHFACSFIWCENIRLRRDFTIEFIDWCTFYYLWHLKR